MNLVLVEKLKNGEVTQTLLSEAQSLQVNPNASYSVFDQATMQPPEGITLKRKGARLEIEVEQEVAVRLEGFYAEGSQAAYSVDGSTSEAMMINASNATASAGEAFDGVVWQASAGSMQASGILLAAQAAGLGVLAFDNIDNENNHKVIEVEPPIVSINALSIPNSAMKVGDVVTVTLSVTNDGGNSYSNVSGTLGGYALTNLTRINNTTYSAQFTVTEGGDDLAASAAIPVSVTLEDSAGNTSAAFTTAISQEGDAIDANSPSISSAPTLDPSADTGVSNTDKITFDTTPTFNGTAEANATIEVFSGSTSLGTTTADDSGNWGFTADTLAEGAHDITATVTDAAGNVSAPSTPLTIHIDTAAPDAPEALNLDASSDTGTSSTDNITNDTTPTFNGIAAVNAIVQISSSADGVLGTTTANDSGNWSFTADTLTQGTHNITASATDAAGNTSSASSALAITIDGTAPAAPSAPDLADSSDTGASNTDNLTSDTTPTFNGTAEADATVELFSGMTSLGTATADGSGNWSFTADTLTQGTHNITARATDAAGNTSNASSILALTIGNTAPAAPSAPDLADSSDTGASNTDNLTSDTTPTFSGMAEANATIELFSGVASLGTTTADGSGNWSFTAGTLGAGLHNITASATDAAGNTSSASSALAITVDGTAPAAPSAPDLAAASDLGESNTDNITSNNTPTFNGTAEANATVELFSGVTSLGTVTANGAGNWSFTAGTLGAGVHNITASATDAAGNTSSASSALAITVDNTAPATPSVPDLALSSDTGSSNTDNITSNNTPTFNGTAEANATVELFSGVTSLGTVTANGAGNWSFTAGTLGAGVHNITATSTDAAGNTSSASSALAITVDGTAPTTPSAPDLALSSDTGTSNTDNITSNNTPTFNGTAEANATVELFSGVTSLGTVTANGAGNWSFTAGTLGAGVHNITASATDAAGNTSSASSALAITVDDNQPSISAVSIPNAAMNVGDVVTVSITASEAGLSLSSGSINGVAVTGFTDNGGGNYSATYTVAEGHTDRVAGDDIPVSFVLQDAAGNTSATYTTAISQASDAIDANSPSISAVGIPNTAMNVGDVVTVSITANEAGLSLSSGSINGVAVTGFTDNGGGSYSATYTVAEGHTDRAAGDDIPVSFVLHDAAGNTSATYTTAISQASDAIDANGPSISAVGIPNTVMNVGDVVTVSITASEAGLSLISGTVNGVAVTGFTDNGGGSYSATYTVAEGHTDRAAGADIPISFVLQDAAGNTSATYTTAISQAGDAIDANTPSISAVSIPDSPLNVGDAVTVTITASETGLSLISGTVNGVAVTGFTDNGGGNYSATYTVAEGHTDRAAGDDIPVSFVLQDAAGNTSATYTTAISQASDAIDANSPSISAVGIPNTAMNVGDVVTVSITASEAGLSLSSGSINGVAVTGFTDNGGGSYSATYTVAEGHTDRTAGADIPVSFVLEDAAGNTSAAFTTAISQGSDAIDANSPSISAVSIPDTVMNVGDVVTVSITASEAGLSLSSGSINGVAVTGFTDNGGGSYSATYTVAEGHTDRTAGADIPVSFVLEDAAGNTSAAFTTAISQGSDAIDANSPSISAVSIPDTVMNVGDVVTVSITASEAGLSLSSGSINGVAVTGFTDNGGGSYSATYTVAEGHTDRAAGADIPLSFVLQDAAGNTSATYTTAISQAGDAIDANTPAISAVGIPNTAMNVGDVVSVSITASEAGLSLSSGSINGVAVTGFTDNGGGNYSATYTVAEGHTDRAAGADIPVSFVLEDAAGNTSAAFTTAISQGSDAIDANSPSISAVSIPDTVMNVGDVVTVSITASEAGLSLSSGSINGVAVTGFTDNGGGSYSATYTVVEGHTDRAAGDDIPVSFVLEDAAGNASPTFTTAISQAGDAIDANSPTLTSSSPSDNAANVTLDANIVLNFNEDIALGTGNIVISDGSQTITIDVASHAGQLSISGGQLTINPSADLVNNSADYNVQIAPSAIVDNVGNAYAGIADSTTLNFTTEAALDTSIVVFDMIGGNSSSHSSRSFQAGVDYTIYLRVDSDLGSMIDPEDWSGWSNLGAGDQILLVGDGTAVLGVNGGIVTNPTTFSTGANNIAWKTSLGNYACNIATVGTLFFSRFAGGTGKTVTLGNSNIGAGISLGFNSSLPTGVLTSQGLI